jgi:hypothetical protein
MLLLVTIYISIPRSPMLTPFTSAVPQDSSASSFSSNWYRNGSLWASLDPAYQGKWYAGVDTKVLWYRSDSLTFNQPLLATGIKLGGKSNNVTSLGNRFSVLYTQYDYQPSSLLFPTDGYWQVTGNVGSLSLTFVIYVYPHSGCQLAGGICAG